MTGICPHVMRAVGARPQKSLRFERGQADPGPWPEGGKRRGEYLQRAHRDWSCGAVGLERHVNSPVPSGVGVDHCAGQLPDRVSQLMFGRMVQFMGFGE
jgi:hypothetical protein